jgi:hypothetical protein
MSYKEFSLKDFSLRFSIAFTGVRTGPEVGPHAKVQNCSQGKLSLISAFLQLMVVQQPSLLPLGPLPEDLQLHSARFWPTHQ